MSRKHFEAVAKVIADVYENHTMGGHAVDAEAVRKVAEGLAVEFEGHNANFDSGRFLAACGVQV